MIANYPSNFIPTNFITKALLIGDPISQSLSPTIHQYFLQQHNLIGSYEAWQVSKQNLTSTIKLLIEQRYAGFNITIPHKEEVFLLCNKLSKTADLIKAVNTVSILSDGSLYGHNSDAFGFYENLIKQQPNLILHNQQALILGAGGASRAVLYSLIKAKMSNIFIVNRNETKLNKLILDFSSFAKKYCSNLIAINWQNIGNILPNITLLVNTTSLGMINQAELTLDFHNLNSKTTVYDIVYKPLYTNLLIQAQKKDCPIITGLDMLVYQAMSGFELWFKHKPIYEEKLKQLLLSKL
jgi:shikimate dehydrogenase